MTAKPAVVESPKSAFVVEMEAAIARRLAAAGWPEKSAVDREIHDIIRRYLGRDAWDAMVDADQQSARLAARCRSRRRRASVARERSRYSEDFDHKLAQAGDRSDD